MKFRAYIVREVIEPPKGCGLSSPGAAFAGTELHASVRQVCLFGWMERDGGIMPLPGIEGLGAGRTFLLLLQERIEQGVGVFHTRRWFVSHGTLCMLGLRGPAIPRRGFCIAGADYSADLFVIQQCKAPSDATLGALIGKYNQVIGLGK